MVIIDYKKIPPSDLKTTLIKNIYLKVHNNFIMFKTFNIRMELIRRGPSWVRFWSCMSKHRFYLSESVHGSSFYPYP